MHSALTSGIADLRAARGLGMDPAAEEGSTSLEQFRADAEERPELSALQGGADRERCFEPGASL